MRTSFEQTLVEVWRQALVDNAKAVELGEERFPVRRTPKRGLRQVDFTFEGNEIRGLEQNPEARCGLCEFYCNLRRSRQSLLHGDHSALFLFPAFCVLHEEPLLRRYHVR